MSTLYPVDQKLVEESPFSGPKHCLGLDARCRVQLLLCVTLGMTALVRERTAASCAVISGFNLHRRCSKESET